VVLWVWVAMHGNTHISTRTQWEKPLTAHVRATHGVAHMICSAGKLPAWHQLDGSGPRMRSLPPKPLQQASRVLQLGRHCAA